MSIFFRLLLFVVVIFLFSLMLAARCVNARLLRAREGEPALWSHGVEDGRLPSRPCCLPLLVEHHSCHWCGSTHTRSRSLLIYYFYCYFCYLQRVVARACPAAPQATTIGKGTHFSVECFFFSKFPQIRFLRQLRARECATVLIDCVRPCVLVCAR